MPEINNCKSQIDYILIKRKWKTTLKIVKPTQGLQMFGQTTVY